MPTIQTLPGSGKIGLNQIGAEFEDPAPVNINETPRDVLWQLDTSLKNKPVKFSNFYGKTNTVFVDISGTKKQINIDTLTNQQKKGHVLHVIVNIKSGARIGSNSTSVPAIQTGSFSNNNSSAIMWINIESNVRIYGRGGNGGAGGSQNTSGRSGLAGGRGGDAILVNGAGTVRINNSGIVAGGGGGGGGGGGYYGCHQASKSGCTKWDVWTGHGGRGGTGNVSGTNAAAGSSGGAGGAGGALGAAGKAGNRSDSHGHSGETRGDGGAGGAAGYAVRRSSGTTVYDKVGDMRGTRQ